MLEVLVAVAVAAPAPVSDLPAWCDRASVDRATAPGGAQWALCQTEDPFGEDRVYVRSGPAADWVMHRPAVGFRGSAPLLAVDGERCFAGGPALVLLTDAGAGARVLVEWDGMSFGPVQRLDDGRFAARRADGREWRGGLTGPWQSVPVSPTVQP